MKKPGDEEPEEPGLRCNVDVSAAGVDEFALSEDEHCDSQARAPP